MNRSIWALRILFLFLCTMAGYAVSQVRPELIEHGANGLAIGFGFGWLLIAVDEMVKGLSLRAFSAVCTHLGCIVRWEAGMEHLYCACHGGMFDRAGRVVGGPPPRPLPRYPVEVREGQVFVKIKSRPPVMGA